MKNNKKIPIKRCKELLEYRNGLLINKVPRGNLKVGDIVGGLDHEGYLQVKIDNIPYKAHRIIWALHYGDPGNNQIDHINQIKNDNRIENLRLVDTISNARNQKIPKNNTSGYIGVTWHKHKQKWAAFILVNNVRKHLGYFSYKKDAIQARKDAEVKYDFHPNHGVS